MLTKVTIEQGLELATGIAHSVDVLTPVSARIRPVGIAGESPGFSILVDRRGFRMTASVVIDKLGRQLRDLIADGFNTDPGAATRIAGSLEEEDWTLVLDIEEDSFSFGATDSREFSNSADIEAGVIAAASILSGHVLQKYRVSTGLSIKPSRRRETGDSDEDGVTWEYDPSERDKSTAQHKALENWLIEELIQIGIQPFDSFQEPQFDVGWRVGETFYACEVKSTRLSETKQLRLGLGQIIHYRHKLIQLGEESVTAALLVERQPEDPAWNELCVSVGVILFWPTSDGIPEILTKESHEA